MPAAPLSDKLAIEAVDAYARNNGKGTLAAKDLGIHPNTFTNRLSVAKSRGFHLSDGVRAAVAVLETRLTMVQTALSELVGMLAEPSQVQIHKTYN
jgi:hypothetical protein